MTITVISGGQTGSDRAGLRAARLCGLPTGGTAPRGYLIETQDGRGVTSDPSLAEYGLVEHKSPTFPPRTFCNVKDSDATLLFVSARAKSERGCDLTREACIKLGKPMLEIRVWGDPSAIPSTAKLAGLIRAKGFGVLNIAGSRASSDPGYPGKPWSGIEGWTFSFLVDVFTLLKESPA